MPRHFKFLERTTPTCRYRRICFAVAVFPSTSDPTSIVSVLIKDKLTIVREDERHGEGPASYLWGSYVVCPKLLHIAHGSYGYILPETYDKLDIEVSGFSTELDSGRPGTRFAPPYSADRHFRIRISPNPYYGLQPMTRRRLGSIIQLVSLAAWG